MASRRCAWCHKPPRWDDPLCSVQVNAADAAPPVLEFIVGLWGEVKQGTMQGGTCRSCAAKLTGQPMPSPILYGPDNRPPEGILGSDYAASDRFPVCGICRQALHEGETTTPIRLQPDDLDLPDDARQRLKDFLANGDKPGARSVCELHGVPMPGAPQGCPECLAKYKPQVLARLQREGHAWALDMTPERMSRGAML